MKGGGRLRRPSRKGHERAAFGADDDVHKTRPVVNANSLGLKVRKKGMSIVQESRMHSEAKIGENMAVVAETGESREATD